MGGSLMANHQNRAKINPNAPATHDYDGWLVNERDEITARMTNAQIVRWAYGIAYKNGAPRADVQAGIAAWAMRIRNDRRNAK